MISLEQFIKHIKESAIEQSIALKLDTELAEVETWLNEYLDGELRLGAELALRKAKKGQRILEVGAGMGLVSIYLKLCGHDIRAIEPLGQSFDFFGVAHDEILKLFPTIDFELWRIPADKLLKEKHGTFDFIFSIHVLEHIENPKNALLNMRALLNSGGQMLHLCPNYNVPYEPHFSKLLVPFKPAWTKYLLPRKIHEHPRWRSINFITYAKITEWASVCNLTVKFDRHIMLDFFNRLDADPLFLNRHKGMLSYTWTFMKITGVRYLLPYLPVRLTTPMLFELIDSQE